MRFPAPSSARGLLAACGLPFLAPIVSAQDGYNFTTIGRVGVVGRSSPLLPTLVIPGANGSVHFFLGNRVLQTLSASGTVTTLVSNSEQFFADGPFDRAAFAGVLAAARVDDATFLVADSSTIRRVATTARTVTTVAGQYFGNGLPIVDEAGTVLSYAWARAIARDRAGDILLASGNTIRRLVLERDGAPVARPVLSIIAGMSNVPASWMDGNSSVARFADPTAVAGDSAGNVFVYDYGNAIIRKITPAGEVSTFAGQVGVNGTADGVGTQAQFAMYRPDMPDYIGRMTIDAADNLIVSDPIHHRIRRITPARVVSTVGGSDRNGLADGFGAQAAFNRPADVALDSAGNLYVADHGNGAIRKGMPVWRPTFTLQPVSQALAPGQTVTLTGAVTGAPAPALQWTRNGTAIAGATATTLTLPNAQIADSGRYALIASNPAGAVTSDIATVTVGGAPSITVQPAALTISSGDALTLSVVATGAAGVQWLKDGQPISGATGMTFTVAVATAADAGKYSVVLTNAAGSTTSTVVAVVVNSSRIVNLSIRSVIDYAAPPITVGFVVDGGNRTVLLRGIGPSLAPFGIDFPLANPHLHLFAGAVRIGFNDDWGNAANAAQVAAAAKAVGAFVLPAGSRDAALLHPLGPGAYSAQILGGLGDWGVVLIELYDAERAGAGRLCNISARGPVWTEEQILVAGFVIAGSAPKTLLIRGVGPSLAAFGVRDMLRDPKLDVFQNGGERPIASNDNWGGSAELAAAFSAQGAFPLDSAASLDAAVLVRLEPGTYSAHVSGVGGRTGEALVEIYDVR